MGFLNSLVRMLTSTLEAQRSKILIIALGSRGSQECEGKKLQGRRSGSQAYPAV